MYAFPEIETVIVSCLTGKILEEFDSIEEARAALEKYSGTAYLTPKQFYRPEATPRRSLEDLEEEVTGENIDVIKQLHYEFIHIPTGGCESE